MTEDIKSRLDIVSLITQYVPGLKKAGRNYKAPCPFHSERTPSFIVFPDSQSWRCFGACADGGDIFKFVMKQEGVDFPTALRMLAEKAGVTLETQFTPQDTLREQHLDKLRGLMSETAQFFHDRLLHSRDAANARAYTVKRGLQPATITQFMIGYAPEGWRHALDHLEQLGYSEADIMEAGIATHNEEKDRVYDRFRNRLMIPISDGKGQVIGFGARALNPDDNPKYLNSPQTPLFDKSAALFGLNFARRAIREGETAVIVEGYMDAIQAHQAGFINVVAQMGTAMTEAQLKQLSRYARRLIIALDPDEAGMKATMRGLEVARQTLGELSPVFHRAVKVLHTSRKLDFDILVITVPDGMDPDDLIRENPDRWQELVDHARPIADYVIAAATAHLTPESSLAEREQIASDLIPILRATENQIQQDYNIQRLALRLRVDQRQMLDWATFQLKKSKELAAQPSDKEVAQRAEKTIQKKVAPAAGTAVSKSTLAIEPYCLAMLLKSDRLYYDANRRLRELAAEFGGGTDALGPLVPGDFSRLDYQIIFESFIAALAQIDTDPIEYLREHLPHELQVEIEQLLVALLDAFGDTLYRSMHTDLRAIRKQYEREGEEEGLVNSLLELRRARLKREGQELAFLQNESDLDKALEYSQKIKANSSALNIIERALRRSTPMVQ
ncbi:MAG TPA: DNA primase [Aggregatilineales bacterium]|nr:DNA primase [Aggregatilineales bacterium]